MRATLKIGIDKTTSHSTKRNKTCAKWLVMMVVGLAAANCANAEKLGRLFFTPEQRAQLDYTYAQSADGSGNNARALTLDGIVQQHGGKRTVWLNGVPQPAGNSNDRAPGSQAVQLPGKKGSVKLKVGQRVLLETSPSPDTSPSDTPDTPGQ